MEPRRLGPFTVSPLGLGCMGMSHAYGAPDNLASACVLHRALDLGCNLLDTAALYGFGANESLLGATLHRRRHEFILASKCGMFRNAAGAREIDGRPETLIRTCDDSLRRLQTDIIDLYYLHRVDPRVPLEDSIGALAGLVRAGKIRSIGLSEVSADTLRRAHAIHPIAAVQSEYSLWTRNPEIRVLAACRELGVAFVAFSPLGRAFLTGALRDPAQLAGNDIRRNMPRFQAPHFARNLALVDEFDGLARAQGCTRAQLALAWLLAQGPHVIPIPGTRQLAHLEENLAAARLALPADALARAGALINAHTVSGARYDPAQQREIGTEEFSRAA
jgi:aryl-alcohol dehydrogenase-like predicted oxidoreductase